MNMEWGRFLRREEGEEGSSNKLWCLAYRGRGEQADQNPKAAAGEWRVVRMWSATDFDVGLWSHSGFCNNNMENRRKTVEIVART